MPFANRPNKRVVASMLLVAAVLGGSGVLAADAVTNDNAAPAAVSDVALQTELSAREAQAASRNQERSSLVDAASLPTAVSAAEEKTISRQVFKEVSIRKAAEAAAEAERQRIAAEEARVAAEAEAARVAAEKAAAEEAARQAAEAAAKEKAAADAAAAEAAKAAKSSKSTKTKTKSADQPAPQAPAAPSNNGDARSIARAMLGDYGWGDDQFSCLDKLWQKESNWRWNADNPSSSAYGIPQALPGSKMSSAGSDWKTNPATQIKWGLGYVSDRYGSPCKAWSHSQAKGWY